VAARTSELPFENLDLQYLFLPTKTRLPIGHHHAKFRHLNINNSRILDICYPDRHILALLIYNGYADEFRTQLSHYRINIHEDFDPCDPSVIRDAVHTTKLQEEKAEIGHRLYCTRLSRALQLIRPSVKFVKFAVARYFHKEHWITDKELEEILSPKTENPANLFRQDDDDTISITSK
jgi:hypothetical protein